MKKISILVLCSALALGASAQRIGHGPVYGGGVVYSPRIVVGVGGYVPFYAFPYFGYGPYPYYPYPYWGYMPPSKLDMQVAMVRSEYRDKVASVKMDKDLTHSEKRDKIHALKSERDQKIHDLKANYYKGSTAATGG